jgi:hypothetical protein
VADSKEAGDFQGLSFRRIREHSMEIAMSWDETIRQQYRRESWRYASDLADEKWALNEPMMPLPSAIGRPRETKLRSVVEPSFT